MVTQKLCACDQTCKSLISEDIDLVDTIKLPFSEIVRDLSKVSHDGLWLNPFRGIPRGPRLSRFDIIYLDEDCRVLEYVENFAEVEFAPISRPAASALILPANTLTASHIQKGDQFRVCKGNDALAGVNDASLPSADEGSVSCLRKSGVAVLQAHEDEVMQVEAAQPGVIEEKLSLKVRFLRWLFPPQARTDRRRGERLPAPGLIVYHWTGGEPKSYQLGDVSQSGLYLLTEERWLPGTRIVMTLQRQDGSESTPEDFHRVESEIIRWGVDGVGCAFVESGFVDLNRGEIVEDQKFDRNAFEQFLYRVQHPASGAGQPG
jgi:hypothetical protein